MADVIYADEMGRTVTGKSLHAVAMTATIIAGAFYRFDIMGSLTAVPGGKLSLYEDAMVGAAASTEYDLLSILYSRLLNLLLRFTGNKMLFAYYFQVVLFMLFVAVAAEAVRMLLGKVASLCFALFVSFMPVFLDSLLRAIISTDELFYLMYGLEILIIANYLHLDSKHKYESKAWIIWFVIVGCAVGFMTYVDAGSFVVILPLLLSGLFIIDNDVVLEIIRLVIILISGFAVFVGMIFQEGGMAGFDTVLLKWSNYFFKNINTFNTFWTYTNYKIEYLVTFIVMSGVLVGFWKNRIFERVTPWLFGTMLVFFAAPFFGATKMNSQVMLTIYFGFVLACVTSLIVTNKLEGKPKAENVAVSEDEETNEDTPDETDEPKDSGEKSEKTAGESPETSGEKGGMQVVTPEKVVEHENVVEPEKVVAPEQIENTNAAFEGYAKRYVPEGMVLPEGAEDEMDTAKSKMKMPEYKGTIALDKKKPEIQKEKPVEKPKKAVSSRKDDFDLPLRPGDDFDI
ncbi:MAG: hypothetical protein K6F75_10635 [Butyrivibrio sp.]|nr:hypothetical protein [Butyrivibrio sp.]